ncbi:MAG: hypothetical protein PHU85_19115, partial [Phycisphaerae bacterium]|nr:hypothetical protein [Phycisphaerae bacterium]
MSTKLLVALGLFLGVTTARASAGVAPDTQPAAAASEAKDADGQTVTQLLSQMKSEDLKQRHQAIQRLGYGKAYFRKDAGRVIPVLTAVLD